MTTGGGRTERWALIPGYEDYDASDQGRIRSRKAARRTRREVPYVLSPTADHLGYLRVTVIGTGQKTRLVHALVMLAFVGPRPAGLDTRHLDGDPANNTLANLAYGTRSENVQDAIRHGRHNYAKKTHCPAGHPYDEENTYLHQGKQRHCKTCGRLRHARRYAAPLVAEALRHDC